MPEPAEPDDERRRRRREASRRGGLKGGRVRAARLTAERRREIARKAARARWAKGSAARRRGSGPSGGSREAPGPPWELERQGDRIVVRVPEELDVAGWESLFDAIVREGAGSDLVVVLPRTIPTVATPGEVFHDVLGTNLRAHGFTIVLSD